MRWNMTSIASDVVLDHPAIRRTDAGAGAIFMRAGSSSPAKALHNPGRMTGGGDLWVTEFVLSYDGVPSFAVSVMEFHQGLVVHETQYFADPFPPGPSRAHLVERAG